MPVQLATNITVELGASQRLRRRRVFLPLIDDLFLSGHGNEFFLLGLTLDCWLPTRSSTGPSGPPSHRNFHLPSGRKVVPIYSGVYNPDLRFRKPGELEPRAAARPVVLGRSAGSASDRPVDRRRE